MKSCEVVYCSPRLSDLKKYPVVCEVPIFSSLVCACLRLERTSVKHLLSSFQNQLRNEEGNTKKWMSLFVQMQMLLDTRPELYNHFYNHYEIWKTKRKKQTKDKKKKNLILIELSSWWVSCRTSYTCTPRPHTPHQLPPAIISNFQSSNKMKIPEKHQNHNVNV